VDGFFWRSVVKPVALISMPTLSARFPSFQLALLKPTLEQAGIPVQTFSLFMYFGTQVGWRLNETLSDVYPSMVGEWIWTKAAFGDFAKNEDYFEIYRNNFEAICWTRPAARSTICVVCVKTRRRDLSTGVSRVLIGVALV
jgi:hypothetical protein